MLTNCFLFERNDDMSVCVCVCVHIYTYVFKY